MTGSDLDLYSTSQTHFRCAFGAPLVALIVNGKPSIGQSCCNHWECPRCGLTRAREEYRRVVWGAEVLADDHKLYFWTLTCRGKELSLEDAEKNYYAWTNTLLTNARTVAKRKNLYWAYVQVTERQHKTRAHPHSHIITTFLPPDAVATSDSTGKPAYISHWFQRANESAGLGVQHRISPVASAAAVSRYVAKYLFKDTMRDEWPPKWKRIRYSQNWPHPPKTGIDLAITLNTPADWHRAETEPVTWVIDDGNDYEIARHRLANIALRVSNVVM